MAFPRLRLTPKKIVSREYCALRVYPAYSPRLRTSWSWDDKPDENGLHGEYVKTGFRPYDLAVTAVLLVAKHHLKDQLVIHSNGADAQWADARRLCQKVLGYGDWFGIIEEKVEEEDGREVTLRILVELEPPEI